MKGVTQMTEEPRSKTTKVEAVKAFAPEKGDIYWDGKIDPEFHVLHIIDREVLISEDMIEGAYNGLKGLGFERSIPIGVNDPKDRRHFHMTVKMNGRGISLTFTFDDSSAEYHCDYHPFLDFLGRKLEEIHNK